MKKKVIYTAILVAGLTFLTFNTMQVSAQTATTKTEAKEVVKYTCTHHPEVVSDKPGKCSKCGMDLVAMKKHEGMKDGKMKMKNDTTKTKHSSKGGMKKGEKGMKKDSTGMGKMKM
jgi:hypothetical protein